ncbi:MAG: hypothetical protein CO137_02400 [Candidatus Magasanikbacteria bacterium CG_4_9_14_3_um_filter_32_9]|uniref:Uncharacterized protein n=1 Tax=Candidatus Magasanikbacteria bacterium CG_4_9_14_3_um_filter_32_9 TaxID=1974644 RepID=A0A2M7Z6N6_9BACT|nr:MAG: hypothetical protein CO137_02400 [Candidatus Magasanikbacteria bacterium CG_4_9_14_3_um_filter_32_9]
MENIFSFRLAPNLEILLTKVCLATVPKSLLMKVYLATAHKIKNRLKLIVHLKKLVFLFYVL